MEDTVVTSGNRGKIGIATAGKTIKTKWFKEGHGFSLKAFARKLLKEGSQLAKDWFAHKRGSMNQKRFDKNISNSKAAAFATKSAKRKKKGSN